MNPGLRQKYSQTFPEYCRQLGFEPRILDTGGCCEYATLLEIAIREGALFTAPESMVDLSKTHIRNIRLADPLYWEVSLVTQKGAMPSPGLAAFLGYMAGPGDRPARRPVGALRSVAGTRRFAEG